MKTPAVFLVILLISLGPITKSDAGDWTRYRGPNGSGVSADEAAVPTKWSATENMKWKIKLPGPGHSSPIILGDKIFITCWTGYAAGEGSSGDQKDLRYHLLCLDRRNGKTIWDKEVKPALPEESYRGMFTQHGYTTHTPATDGERVYSFFGKTGVVAFDLKGERLWQTSVGTKRNNKGWGSASSPILYKNFVIVLASIENSALVALDKKTGKQAWIAEADGLDSLWGTPVLVDAGEGKSELVVVTNGEIWALNPDNGKLRWYSAGPGGRSISISAVSHKNVVYALGGREGGTAAVRAGGRNDVTDSHRIWESNRRGGTGTPVFHDGRLYWVDSGTAYAIDAESGDEVYRERIASGAAPAEAEAQPRQRPPSGGGFGRGGGGGMTRDYPSPVVAGGMLYQLSGAGEVTVIKLGEDFELVGKNRFDGDGSRFVATPAISNGQMFVRSEKFLYCIGK